MRMVEIIAAKRDGRPLTTAEIEWVVKHYVAGDIPDYQMAALAMAIVLRGMDDRETADLTIAMANSGDTLDLHDIAPITVDKHSTGGVGDKTNARCGADGRSGRLAGGKDEWSWSRFQWRYY
jgi:pyrimidine-nucleoside phosphorylase